MLHIINLLPSLTNSQQNTKIVHDTGLYCVGYSLPTVTIKPTIKFVLVVQQVAKQLLVVLVPCWFCLANRIKTGITVLIECLLAVGSFLDIKNGVYYEN